MSQVKGIVAATYRSGTRWIATAFRKTYRDLPVHHEPRWEEIQAQPGLEVGWTVPALVSQIRDTYGPVPVLHLLRDPVDVARSAHRQGLDTAEGALAKWYATHTLLCDLASPPWLVLRVEDLWKDPFSLGRIASFFGLPNKDELRQWHARRIGWSTAAITVPAFTLPDKVVKLARTFGYPGQDAEAKTYQHVVETH